MEKTLMNRKLIRFDDEAATKEEVIARITQMMERDGRLLDRQGYEADVLLRESQASTAVGFLTATPHAKSEFVKIPALSFIRLKQPLKWDGQEDVLLVFQVAVPARGQGDRHLEILAALFRKLVHDEFRIALLKAATAEEVLTLVGKL